jgi:hypothetical protein
MFFLTFLLLQQHLREHGRHVGHLGASAIVQGLELGDYLKKKLVPSHGDNCGDAASGPLGRFCEKGFCVNVKVQGGSQASSFATSMRGPKRGASKPPLHHAWRGASDKQGCS